MTLDDFFPQYERVLYRRPQLREVVCQLRFPPILRIEGQPPADFQDQIRSVFPLMQPATNPIAERLPSEIAQLLGGGASSGRYQFRTEDGHTTLSLARDSIALSTTAYTRWENFRSLLRSPLAALVSIYKPSFYQRIGLRYINAIRREDLDLTGQSWSSLFNPAILGELALSHWERCLLDAKRLVRITTPDRRTSMLLQHGLAELEGQPGKCYSIDFDFYTDLKTETHDAEPVLEEFNRFARRGFRWCITDRLHSAMAPKPIS